MMYMQSYYAETARSPRGRAGAASTGSHVLGHVLVRADHLAELQRAAKAADVVVRRLVGVEGVEGGGGDGVQLEALVGLPLAAVVGVVPPLPPEGQLDVVLVRGRVVPLVGAGRHALEAL